jgi:spore germination protein YaaH
MRDKYIELIKEYIKAKPEYKTVLNEIKADVLTIGATEEEFDEAINQMTDAETAKLILGGPQDRVIEQPPAPATMPTQTTMPQVQQPAVAKTAEPHQLAQPPQQPKPAPANYLKKLTPLIWFARDRILTKKKYFAAGLAVLVIIFVLILSLGKKDASKIAVNNLPSIKIPIVDGGTIPLVYATSQTIDSNKIFSVKSNNVQLTVTTKPKKEVLGFFPYWMLPNQDQIDLAPLTSISLFGLEVDGNGNVITGNADDDVSGGWAMWRDPKLDDLLKRAKDEDVKIYLTLKCFDSSNIEKIATSDDAQKTLIANALYFVNSKALDGINIDFEYVGNPTDEVRSGFTRFITNLNAELKRQVPNTVLTIDTYLVSGSEKGIFDIPMLAKNSDAFVIMGYDMHTPLGEPGPVSAMGGVTNIIGYVQNYLEQVDASKLILAVPYYGYDWPETQASPSADMVKILPYAEIMTQSQNLQLNWDDTSETPSFTYNDDAGQPRIVHFDNVRSLGIKYDFINQKNLRGVGIWALGYDGQNQDLEKLLIDKFINQ